MWIDLASSDDIPAINSYLDGLSKRPQSANRYLIHTSGTGMLADFSTGEGNEAPKIYSDVEDVEEITTLPLTHFHRDVDNAVISGGQEKNIKTAIVSPPTIYGVGKGPLKKRSIQVPALIAGILSRGKGFTVGEGNSVWDLVHIDDLGAAYILLIEEALKENGGRVTWGPQGYYFVETGEFVSDPDLAFHGAITHLCQHWKDIAEAVSKYAVSKGLIQSADLDKLTGERSASIHPWGPLIWGSNCRSRADRLRKLGWKGQAPDIYAEIPSMVEFEVNKEKA